MDEVGQAVEVGGSAPKEEGGVCRASRQPLTPGRAVAEILDRRAEVPQRLMLHDLLRPLQCHDVQPKAPPLEIKQLVENERLRQTRETVDEDDKIDLSATSAPCDCPGTQLPQPAPQVSQVAHAPGAAVDRSWTSVLRDQRL